MGNEMRAWVNGRIVEPGEARISLLSSTLHYGFGAFEGIRCYSTGRGPAIFRLRDHVKRLTDSWHAMGMECPYSREEIAGAAKSVVRANGLDSCYIRPIIFLTGIAFDPHACETNVAVACWKWDNFFGDKPEDSGIRAVVSSIARPHVNSTLSKAKITGVYYNSFLAKGLAKKQGFDDAIMLDPNGLVGEGTAENVFIARNGAVSTPKRRGILEGITRDSVMRIAKDLGYCVSEDDITRDELYIADEVFLTGTAAEIECVAEIDCRRIGTGKIGPVAAAIRSKFRRITAGKEPGYADWLEYVNDEAEAGPASGREGSGHTGGGPA
ncbi:MAG: branched-chain amino acid transaminase [Candidatus Micrarchaeota archaeon]|nr:branched-chain amino acid transaminase [Candidatus Micrarchaeota archaeon]